MDKHKYIFSEAISRDFSVMPVWAQTGNPVPEVWGHLNFEKPSQDLADEWDKKFQIGEKFGIAIICGPASSVEILDIDTTDPVIHALCPKSPYGKYGTPGRAAYFFRYNKDHQNISEKKTGVGLYNNTKYHIIDPSIHRTTKKPYGVLGKSIWDADIFDLPELDIAFFKTLPELTKEQKLETGGRNNKLRDIITAMRTRGESEEKIIREILHIDKDNTPPLFTDPEEGFRAKNEDERICAAFRMVNSVTKSLLDAKIKIPVITLNSEIDSQQNHVKFTHRPLPPMPEGFISSFVSAANSMSRVDISFLASGGAISTMCALASGRFKFRGTWPNEYLLALAPSGFGKGIPFKIIKEILMGTSLTGADLYKSTQAFLEMLPKFPNRLDLIDEASAFFAAMNSNQKFVSDLSDTLNRIYSSSSSRFDGISTVTHGQKAGACWNPCVTLYCATHPTGFLETARDYFAKSGLLPRFLIFQEFEIKRNAKKPRNLDDISPQVEDLRNFVTDFIKKFKIQRTSSYTNKPIDLNDETNIEQTSIRLQPREMDITKEALEYIELIDDNNFNFMLSSPEEENAFLARYMEHVHKLSMVAALSDMRVQIEIKDVQWAAKLVETLMHNSNQIKTEIRLSNPNSSKVSKLVSYLKIKGSASLSDISNRLKMYGSSLSQLLRDCENDGIVSHHTFHPPTGRPRTEYRLLTSSVANSDMH